MCRVPKPPLQTTRLRLQTLATQRFPTTATLPSCIPRPRSRSSLAPTAESAPIRLTSTCSPRAPDTQMCSPPTTLHLRRRAILMCRPDSPEAPISTLPRSRVGVITPSMSKRRRWIYTVDWQRSGQRHTRLRDPHRGHLSHLLLPHLPALASVLKYSFLFP